MFVNICFEAQGTEVTMEKVLENFAREYPEYSSLEVKETLCDKGEIKILWIGETETSEEELVRLTHHAEGMYEGTDAEYVNVEVCINGKWY